MRSVTFLLAVLALLLGITANDSPAIAKRQIRRQDVVSRASRTRNRRDALPSCIFSPSSPFFLRLSSPATSFVQTDGTSTGYFRPTPSVTTATQFVLVNGNVQIAGSTNPAQFIKVSSVPSLVLSCPQNNCGTIVPLSCTFNTLRQLSCTSSLNPTTPPPFIQFCPSQSKAFIWNTGLFNANCVQQTLTAVPVACV